jgi:hypothetical protein
MTNELSSKSEQLRALFIKMTGETEVQHNQQEVPRKAYPTDREEGPTRDRSQDITERATNDGLEGAIGTPERRASQSYE